MTTPPLASLFQWEQSFFAFLRAELAPSPARWRNALRLTLLCVLGTTLVVSLHLPYGEFLIIFFFAVSQPDAWASLRKARLRGLGTLVGGAFAVLIITCCGDKPWLFFVVQGLIFAVALFLSRTTTIPYVVILAMFTFVIATPAVMTSPEASLEKVFWRILLTITGAVLGTVAQLGLWPEHPEQLLLRQLAGQLQTAETILERLAAGDAVPRQDGPDAAQARTSVAAAVANQLDLLASAEAGSAGLRARHDEQVQLITDVEMVLLAARRLEQLANHESWPDFHTAPIRARLQKVRHELARIRRALEAGRPPASPERPDEPEPAADASDETGLRTFGSALRELERAWQQLRASAAYLNAAEAGWRRGGGGVGPLREPVAQQGIFTPACSLLNVEAVRFALKGTLAASFCYLLYQALDWPGLSTSVVTCLITAQSSFGAGLQKSMLRLAGATLGAFAAVTAVIVVLPNVSGEAAFVVVTGVLFFGASWVTTGSTRISYVGLQTGLVLALVLVNRPGPTTDLAPAFDRILGVLLGITVMGFIDLTLWPNFAGTALRKKLAETWRALAEISRHAARQDGAAAEAAALRGHVQIAAVLSLHQEGQLEFGARAAGRGADRNHWRAVIHRMEVVLLAMLTALRSRRRLESSQVSSVWSQRLSALDEAIAQNLEAQAGPTGEPASAHSSDPARCLADLESEWLAPSIQAETNPAQSGPRQECVTAYRELVDALARLETEVASTRSSVMLESSLQAVQKHAPPTQA